MEDTYVGFREARNEVSASSAGGAPFLICYGFTFLLVGFLSFFIPRSTASLLAMFQGAIALPCAFLLERKMGLGAMTQSNPLRSLSAQLAISQGLAIPFLIVAYSVNPAQIPVMMAGLGGVHFLPYSWLHRTRIYTGLAVLIAVGSFLLVLVLQTSAYSFILLLVGLSYWAASPLVYWGAKRNVKEALK